MRVKEQLFESNKYFWDDDDDTPVVDEEDVPSWLPKCECGADKCKLPVHSEWCPKYIKE